MYVLPYVRHSHPSWVHKSERCGAGLTYFGLEMMEGLVGAGGDEYTDEAGTEARHARPYPLVERK